jgi:hypothetical protein
LLQKVGKCSIIAAHGDDHDGTLDGLRPPHIGDVHVVPIGRIGSLLSCFIASMAEMAMGRLKDLPIVRGGEVDCHLRYVTERVAIPTSPPKLHLKAK